MKKQNLEQEGAFIGLKVTMSNITIKKWIDSKGNLQYCIYRGKGKGRMLTMSQDWYSVVKFNVELPHAEYKIIYAVTDGRKSGAWFTNNIMCFPEHPFMKDGGFTFHKPVTCQLNAGNTGIIN